MIGAMRTRAPLAASLLCLLVACGGHPPSETTDDPVSDDRTDSGGPDASPPTDDTDVPHKVVFVSSSLQDGDLGGLAGADRICADLAEAAGLEGEFKAWVSSPDESAADRLAHADVPYARTDGIRVADDWADLVDGELAQPIDRDEEAVPVEGDVWTGTRATGGPADSTCSGFASRDESGVCGATDEIGADWTDHLEPPCDAELRLYCLQQ
jgi:hypothetical protein